LDFVALDNALSQFFDLSQAFSANGSARTWNLLTDVIGQSGRYRPNATSLQNDFAVEGERHYWLYVAIDQFRGQVVDKQIEVVNE